MVNTWKEELWYCSNEDDDGGGDDDDDDDAGGDGDEDDDDVGGDGDDDDDDDGGDGGSDWQNDISNEIRSCQLPPLPSFLSPNTSMKVALWIKLCCDTCEYTPIIDNSTRLAQVGYRVPWNNYRQLLQIVVGCDGVS